MIKRLLGGIEDASASVEFMNTLESMYPVHSPVYSHRVAELQTLISSMIHVLESNIALQEQQQSSEFMQRRTEQLKEVGQAAVQVKPSTAGALNEHPYDIMESFHRAA